MITQRQIAEQAGIIKPPMEIFEIIHNVSMYLLVDDMHDLGRGQYTKRTDYYYHGKHSPEHPSPFHHWVLGYFGILTSQIGTALLKGLELYEDYKKIEGGDLSDIDEKIINLVEEDNTISLEEYKDELDHLPKVSELPDASSLYKGSKTSYQNHHNVLEIPKPEGLPGY